MNLLTWLLTEHPFFCDTKQRLLDSLARGGIKSLDNLTIRSRRPVRTVLLVLDDLIQSGQVEIIPNGIVPKGRQASTSSASIPELSWTDDTILSSLRSKYLELVVAREQPALLWGQRRLVPDSAIERALYILTWLERRQGTIAFLGDDDLVSPLVAASVPEWEVHVVDIDSAVLQQVQRVALGLGTQLFTHHTDLSQASLDYQGACDMVIGDPFPSGDGSFEVMFWEYAAQILKPGGVLITTVAPSHKPTNYSAGALHQLQCLGFCLFDLQADYGRYEVFDFEFIPFERNILSRLGLQSTVSQTKSLLAAKYAPNDRFRTSINPPDFDFERWCRATATHYLTVQAGVDSQQRIANERGVQEGYDSSNQFSSQHGLRIDGILPPSLRTEESNTVRCNVEDTIRSYLAVLSQHFGVETEEDELNEIRRLAVTSELQPDGFLAKLGLAIRAIESWERWQLDE